LAGRLVKNLDDESFLLELAAGSSKVRPQAWTALRLTRLLIANGLECCATRFEVSDKKPGAAAARRERDSEKWRRRCRCCQQDGSAACRLDADTASV
jgi:hypothetical protein